MNENENVQEVTELLEMLYNTIADAWGVPFGKEKCMLHRENTLNLVDDIRAQLPLELAESRRLLSAREEFIANAKREAESVRKAAETEARRLVEEQEIIRIAKERANEIISTAEAKSRELINVANSYVDDALRRTEEAIAAAHSEVKESRSRFCSLAGSKPAPDIQSIAPNDYEE
ncbi:MAG: hypothetical protein GXY26_06550 [Clostridiales bacterium]|jgi:cell division septum initiation protein DivIVA|nr:hypothetical protein [Clostridiales bacterium]